MADNSESLRENKMFRWGVLFLISFVMAANYYFYDALSPLKQKMGEMLGFTSSDYGFFIAAYSIPNVFLLMAVLGGMITDRFGIRITGFCFVFFMFAGSCITWYGASPCFNEGGFGYSMMNSFWTRMSPPLKVMSLGYFLFGLGAETSIVVITKSIVKWFKGKEIALALGTNLAIARLGAALSLIVTPQLMVPEWTTPIWFGALLLGIGFVLFLVYMVIDFRFDRKEKDLQTKVEESFRFKDVLMLITNRSFLYIALLCVTFYSAVFPFMKYAPDLLQNKFSFSEKLSGIISSSVYFGTIIFTPLFGWFTDNKGKSASLMVYGSGLLIIVHLALSLTTITPIVPMLLLGIAFSLIPAAMWPSVTKIVEQSRIGSAYGLMFSIQNLGLWGFALLIGYVLDKSNPGITAEMVKAGEARFDYTNPILMLATLGIFGFLFALLLKREDKVSGYGLELPNKKN
ncbi:MAG: MFS transporter [Bacteroidales bacterium]|nr:MFS transporter [Bacteroidales bacterium]